MNSGFLGIDLATVPQFNIFNSKLWAWDWAHIGALLIPLISAGSQILQTLLNQRANNSLITDKNGLQTMQCGIGPMGVFPEMRDIHAAPRQLLMMLEH